MGIIITNDDVLKINNLESFDEKFKEYAINVARSTAYSKIKDNNFFKTNSIIEDEIIKNQVFEDKCIVELNLFNRKRTTVINFEIEILKSTYYSYLESRLMSLLCDY